MEIIPAADLADFARGRYPKDLMLAVSNTILS